MEHGHSHNVADRRKRDVRLVAANQVWPVRTRSSAKAGRATTSPSPERIDLGSPATGKSARRERGAGRMGIPALVLGKTGKVLSANSLIEAMSGYVYWRAFDRVSLEDPSADHLLRDAIAAVGSESGSGVRSFPVRDMRANAMMVAHVIPVRLSALRCAAILTLTPVTTPQAPPVELIQSLFDLTPAEARIGTCQRL